MERSLVKDNANSSSPLLDRRQSGGNEVHSWYASAAPRPAEILLQVPRHSGFVPRAKATLISGDGTSPAPHGVICTGRTELKRAKTAEVYC
jgi:hypothetical protein